MLVTAASFRRKVGHSLSGRLLSTGKRTSLSFALLLFESLSESGGAGEASDCSLVLLDMAKVGSYRNDDVEGGGERGAVFDAR